MHKDPRVILATILAAELLSAAPALCSDFEDGVSRYSGHDYRGAVAMLAGVEAAEPANAVVRYYLANALVYLKQHDRAMQEYRISYALDPTGPAGRYCADALRAYHEELPEDREIKTINDTICGAIPQDAGKPIWVVGSATVVHAGHSPEVNQSLAVIQQQLAIEKRKHEQLCSATGQDALTCAQKAACSIQENVEQQVQNLYAPKPRSMAYLGDLSAREQQIRDRGKEEQEWVLRQAQLKAERYQQLGELQKSALDQVADNLENQLADDGTSSGVRLVASGTNLYVRSYASVKPKHAIPDTHLAVARIYAQQSSGVKPQSAQAGSLPENGVQVKREVYGKILKQPGQSGFQQD